MSYVCYLLNHISSESLKGQIPLAELYGVTPDISILMIDAITHKLLDNSSNKIICRSAVCPADDIHPKKHLLSDFGESVKSHQDLDKSVSKPMAEYNPDDIIGRTFLLPPNQKGERHRASIKQKS